MSSESHQKRTTTCQIDRMATTVEKKEDPTEVTVLPENLCGEEKPCNSTVRRTRRTTSQNDRRETKMPENTLPSSTSTPIPIDKGNKRGKCEISVDSSEEDTDTAVNTKSFRGKYTGMSLEDFAVNFASMLNISESPEIENNPGETPKTQISD